MAQPNTRRPPGKDALAEGLGWFSVGLGTAQLAMPRVLCRTAGVSDGSRNATLMRGRGVTEVAKGVGILIRPKPTNWFWTATISEPSTSSDGSSIFCCIGYGVGAACCSLSRVIRCEG